MDLRKEEVILALKLDDDREEGREEGIKIGAVKVAKNLLKADVSIDVISQTTGLSIGEVKHLQEENNFFG
jgi:predicted transposase/invertase (TIGR01784 family)